MLPGIRLNLLRRAVCAVALACLPLAVAASPGSAAQTIATQLPTTTANRAAIGNAPAALRQMTPPAALRAYSPRKAAAPLSAVAAGRRNTPPASPPRASAPGTGAQLLQDPGFEFGPGDPYWAESSSGGFEMITPTSPHSGRYSADLCAYPNDTPACQDVISQQLNFNVPSGIISAQLSYFLAVGTQESASSCPVGATPTDDYVTIGIFDSTNTADPTNAATYCAADWGDQLWHSQSINVTSYLQAHAGQSLHVTMQGIDDANGASSEFFFDDLALSIYTAPAAPSNVLAQADNSEATVSWQAPVDGGSPITSYTVTPYTNNGVTAGTPVTFNSSSTIEVVSGLINGTAYSFDVAATNAYATGAASSKSNSATPDRAYGNEVASTSQYTLSGSDGTTWQPMDPSYLSTSITPSSDSLAVLDANVDLWTANNGFNQDIGIAVAGGTGVGTTYPTISGQPEAWKESGGFAGTFSPNAAAVHSVIALKASSSYTFKLVWKTNRAAPGTTIVAGAGPIGASYSPTRMTIQLLPASGTPLSSPNLATSVSTRQFTLAGNNGNTWTDLGSGAPSLTFMAPSDGLLNLKANADLWTTVAGINQDLGISVSGGAYPTVAGQPELWKESGGFAGTFSPNAAAAEGTIAVSKGTTYSIKLQWKANHATSGAIVAGAGPIGSNYSPTRLTAQMVPGSSGPLEAVSNQQYGLANNDGATWADIDPVNLKLVIAPTNNCVATLIGNADLWTANAGINQDLGIQVSSTAGTFSADRVGWKESGGFAGTFSPNAALVLTQFPMNAGTTYTVKLQWKANRNASGGTIYAGAGPIGPKFSSTRLTAELACPAPASDRITTTAQTVTAGNVSGPVTVQLLDTYGNPAPAGVGGQTFAISAVSTSGQATTLDANGTPSATLVIPAGASSGSFKFKDSIAESLTLQVQAAGFSTLTQTESVTPGATSQFKVQTPSTAARGTAFNVTVTAEDRFGNTTPAYAGTVHFTSSDAAASLPANYAFVSTDNGVRTFSVTLNTAGTQTISVTDTGNAQITGVSGAITVS